MISSLEKSQFITTCGQSRKSGRASGWNAKTSAGVLKYASPCSHVPVSASPQRTVWAARLALAWSVPVPGAGPRRVGLGHAQAELRVKLLQALATEPGMIVVIDPGEIRFRIRTGPVLEVGDLPGPVSHEGVKPTVVHGVSKVGVTG